MNIDGKYAPPVYCQQQHFSVPMQPQYECFGFKKLKHNNDYSLIQREICD
jgi:hypothetical protein